jgi:hypothetical protein
LLGRRLVVRNNATNNDNLKEEAKAKGDKQGLPIPKLHEANRDSQTNGSNNVWTNTCCSSQ